MPKTGAHGKRRLQGTQSGTIEEAQFGVIQVVAISVGTASEFVSTMVTVSDFNTVQALSASLVVIFTFIALWVGVPASILAMHHFYHFLHKSHNRALSKIAPADDSRPSSEAALKSYVTTFFPDVYAPKSTLLRLLSALLVGLHQAAIFNDEALMILICCCQMNHDFFAAAKEDDGYRLWLGILKASTNQTAQLFILAVVC